MTGRLDKLLAGGGLNVPGLTESLVRELCQGNAGITVDVRVPGT